MENEWNFVNLFLGSVVYLEYNSLYRILHLISSC